ncbi:MAG: glycerol-3-phosphate dehydrogenase/oxidase [Bryobacteraceae bacterium]|nr:glycerol-3-phosphate dehydrogenase/oxidase [Bryobacteraceae bacterium]
MAVIGGGATGLGVALDAATRGYATVLIEQADFGKGTSSRSTKLVHGGVRYLAQGNVPLVREALYERGLLLKNAPGLAHALGFVIPASSLAEAAWYRSGIGAYDFLAGAQRLGNSKWLSANEVSTLLPGIRPAGVRAGVLFYDGQFDDARLLISIALTAAAAGAVLINYVRAERVSAGEILAEDVESGEPLTISARVVVNATGAWSDRLRPGGSGAVAAVRVSRGSHIVVDRAFLPGTRALLIPKTPDGRVLFAIPWLGHTLIGTTDVETDDAPLDPVPSLAEVDFILETAARYLANAPTRRDVTSMWAGLRPLAAGGGDSGQSSASLSRGHSVVVDPGGLVNVMGGKWTTYRKMAEDAVDAAAKVAGLASVACRTQTLPLLGEAPVSGLRAAVLRGVHDEMARTVDDVLARRTRLLFLNADEAIERAPEVAGWMAAELGKDQAWSEAQVRSFVELAAGYRINAAW